MSLSTRSQLVIAILVLLGITLFVFLPSINNGFTNWDDPAYITENPDVQSLSWHNIRTYFLKSYMGMGGYTPMVLISYALEYHFFGPKPRVFHRHNLVLHLLNCLLVFFLIYLLCRDPLVCLVTTLFFAIHPVQVEAVAWIQGRKDLLFSFFYLTSLILYIVGLQKGNKKRFYYFSLLFFLLSLLSKILAMSLPLVLLAIDYYKGRGFNKTAVINKIPYLALAVAFVIFSIFSVSTADYSSFTFSTNILHNLFLFFYAIIFYVNKALAPLSLSARYSTAIPAVFPTLAFHLILFSAAAFVFYRIKKSLNRESVFSLLFFCLTLLPTAAFYLIGKPYADRYLYIPLIGIFFLAALWVVKWATASGPSLRVPILFTLVVVVVGCAILSRSRINVWRNSQTLWSDVIRHDPQSGTAYLNRGEAYLAEDKIEAAYKDMKKALIMNPRNANVYNNLGIIHFKTQRYQEALACYNRSIQLDPHSFRSYWNRGNLWGKMGRYQLAIADFSKALSMNATSTILLYYRGVTYKRVGQMDQAIADFNRILNINPDYWRAYLERGLAYVAQEKYTLALGDVNRTIQLQPQRIRPYEILRDIYKAMGREGDAQRIMEMIERLKGKKLSRSG